MKPKVVSTILALLLSWFCMSTKTDVMAQIGGSGSIQGIITDPSVAVVPGATVVATNVATGGVYLPAGYEENPLKRYPVLYMHDAKNLFFPEEAFQGMEWQIDKTLDLLEAMNIIERVIVVGVYAINREEEYTKPGYKEYGRSLVEEVKPFIDSRFRTLHAPSHTGVMGSSLGGVVSFYLAWQWPEVFGRAVCMSSSFTMKDDLIERVINEPQRNIRVYLDSGWPGDNYEVTLSMCMALIERGYLFGRDFFYFVFPHATHDEASWGTRCHLPLQLFSGEASTASAALAELQASQMKSI